MRVFKSRRPARVWNGLELWLFLFGLAASAAGPARERLAWRRAAGALTATSAAGTPYEGGQFKIRLQLGADFPAAPPKGFFVTKIFHPNVSKTGEICVNTLKKDWHEKLGIRHVLITIRCLLIVPNPESALNEEAGKLLLEQYEEYAKQARLMTSIHAARALVAPAPAAAPVEATVYDLWAGVLLFVC